MNEENNTKSKRNNFETEVVLKVENLSKKFCLNLKRSMYYGLIDVIRNMFGFVSVSDQLRKEEFWALKDISFELRRGETLGVIGVNGSGKSTLLRLISGIFPPDEGRICFKGKIGALIAVGAGFHPHMTGRENIYLNGVILGMSIKEIDQKFDAIVGFADIGDFLNAPVSTYSSGMRVRLGFSIAVHSEPDILLIDEILSVGDSSFRSRCYKKIDELKGKVSIIFISHSPESVGRVCDRAILLHKGKLKMMGSVRNIYNVYNDIILEKENNYQFLTEIDGDFKIENATLKNSKGQSSEQIFFKENFDVHVEINSPVEEEVSVEFDFIDSSNNAIIRLNGKDERKLLLLKKGGNLITLRFDEMHLASGNYRVDFYVFTRSNISYYIRKECILKFSILDNSDSIQHGVYIPKHDWGVSYKKNDLY